MVKVTITYEFPSHIIEIESKKDNQKNFKFNLDTSKIEDFDERKFEIFIENLNEERHKHIFKTYGLGSFSEIEGMFIGLIHEFKIEEEKRIKEEKKNKVVGGDLLMLYFILNAFNENEKFFINATIDGETIGIFNIKKESRELYKYKVVFDLEQEEMIKKDLIEMQARTFGIGENKGKTMNIKEHLFYKCSKVIDLKKKDISKEFEFFIKEIRRIFGENTDFVVSQ